MSTDEEAVRALVIAYAERLDAGDLDGVASLFDDAVVRSAHTGGALTGRDAVRRMYEPVIRYDDGTPRTKHVLGNLEVTVDGDTARSRCTFTVFQAVTPGRLGPVLTGRYLDQFARHHGGWRFVERVIAADLLGDLSGHMRR